MRRGWISIPGVQDGDRTLKEQMTGLDRALKECPGKTVLDAGCAEGLIGYEFAKAGALRVIGFDILESHIWAAKKYCPDPRMSFKVRDLNVASIPRVPSYDIVLALAILHKLIDPAHGVRYCTNASKSLVVVRLPINSSGLIVGKHSRVECDVPRVMDGQGFRLAEIEKGPRGEWVHYYRRVA